MNNTTKENLRKWFYQINRKQYHKYFEEWFNNLTIGQIKWFEKIF